LDAPFRDNKSSGTFVKRQSGTIRKFYKQIDARKSTEILKQESKNIKPKTY
jgi:hypothetical protein